MINFSTFNWYRFCEAHFANWTLTPALLRFLTTIVADSMSIKNYIHVCMRFLFFRPKKSVSCNPTLTSFYSQKSLPLSFSALPTPNQHTFLNKKIIQTIFTDVLALYFLDHYRKQTIFFSLPYTKQIDSSIEYFLNLLILMNINEFIQHEIWVRQRHTFLKYA